MGANSKATTMDGAIEHKRGCKRLNVFACDGILPIGATESPLTTIGAGATPAVCAEISSFARAGLAMDNGDTLQWILDRQADLWDVDMDHDLLFQILFTSINAAAIADVDWKAYIKGFAAGAAMTVGTATPDGTIVYPAAAVAAQYAVSKTVEMGFLVPAKFDADEEVAITVELVDRGATAAANEIVLTGARLFYTREICHPTGVRQST